ncbi:VOC family protein [Pseudarthrobacter sp. TAF60_1]|uniref:VOC family protein n=1 Tax=Pseudarthrobacter sp. TAF60_1 TaxID=3233071 RepID=UPI003F9864E4
MTARTYPQGVPCWIDTEQPDVEAAVEFYAGLFGWTCEDVLPPGAPGRYLIAKLDGQDVGGIGSAQEGAAVWSTYVAVDDADAAVQRLVDAGATVRAAAADAGEGGRSAVLTDPEGAEFRIWQARRRLGAQVANLPGAWNFSDLHTPDPGAAIAFYEQAFGWQVDDIGFGMMIRRPGYGDHLDATVDPGIRARQSVLAAPPGFEDAIAWIASAAPDEPPHWHVSFTVADRDRTVVDAERLGAKVLSESDTQWTRTALIRDPQGAEFTASEFTPPAA